MLIKSNLALYAPEGEVGHALLYQCPSISQSRDNQRHNSDTKGFRVWGLAPYKASINYFNLVAVIINVEYLRTFCHNMKDNFHS